MKRILVVGAMLAGPLVGLGDEHFATLKAGSEVYSNVTVTSATTSQIYFTHSRGIGGAKLKELDADLQSHFHYDATTAASAELRRIQEDAQYRQNIASASATNRSSASLESASKSATVNGEAAQVQTVTQSASSRRSSVRVTAISTPRPLPAKAAPLDRPAGASRPSGGGNSSLRSSTAPRAERKPASGATAR
jgi:hypothetical protein